MTTYLIKDSDPTDRSAQIGECIYCGSPSYGEEHVIPRGAGGTLVLGMASCRECEEKINRFETEVLKSVLYVPRVAMGVRRRRRKRPLIERISVMAEIEGKGSVTVELPLNEYPSVFFLPELVPPGVLLNRPVGEGLLSGAWVRSVRPAGFKLPPIKGLKSIASPVLNSQNFCRFLAKIAHGFAVYSLGLTGFDPLLTDFIRSGSESGWCHFVGGNLVPRTGRSDNLHELSLSKWNLGADVFLVVTVRLFAKMESPSYLIVVGDHLRSQRISDR